MSCANSGFMGYPILLIAMPAVADRALALNMIVENLVMIPLILVLAERSRGGGAGCSGRSGGWRPIRSCWRSLAGLVVALTPLAVPAAIGQAIDLVARSSAAVSLVVIGGALVGVPRAAQARAGSRRWSRASSLLHPLAVGAGFAALGVAGVAGRPGDGGRRRAGWRRCRRWGSIRSSPAQYGQGAPAAVAMLAMTVGAFFTIGGLLWLLGLVPGLRASGRPGGASVAAPRAGSPRIARACAGVATGRSCFSQSSTTRRTRAAFDGASVSRSRRTLSSRPVRAWPPRRDAPLVEGDLVAADAGAAPFGVRGEALQGLDVEVEDRAVDRHRVLHAHDELDVERRRRACRPRPSPRPGRCG